MEMCVIFHMVFSHVSENAIFDGLSESQPYVCVNHGLKSS